jgi:hypothetical protein
LMSKERLTASKIIDSQILVQKQNSSRQSPTRLGYYMIRLLLRFLCITRGLDQHSIKEKTQRLRWKDYLSILKLNLDLYQEKDCPKRTLTNKVCLSIDFKNILKLNSTLKFGNILQMSHNK